MDIEELKDCLRAYAAANYADWRVVSVMVRTDDLAGGPPDVIVVACDDTPRPASRRPPQPAVQHAG